MPQGELNMVMIGDAYIQRADPDSAFEPVRPFLANADIGFCNLETVIADRKYLDPDDHDTRPRSDESALPAYLRAGFNVMNIANNPGMYHGLRAFLRSLDVLDAAGVVYAGGGRNLAEARRPAIIEKKGTRVAFVCRTAVGLVSAAATPERGGVARFAVSTAYEAPARIADVPGSPPLIHTIPDPQDKAALEEDIRAAKKQADLVIVSWHWGVSPHSRGIGDLAGYQVEMGRASIDAGADLVVGHHAHVPQPIEVYKGKPIVYSLANYVHDMFEGERKLSTILVRCLIRDGKIARLSFVPGLVDGSGPPRYFKPREAVRVVNHVVEISVPFGTRFEVGEDEVSVALEAPESLNALNPLAEHAVSRSAYHWRRAAGL